MNRSSSLFKFSPSTRLFTVIIKFLYIYLDNSPTAQNMFIIFLKFVCSKFIVFAGSEIKMHKDLLRRALNHVIFDLPLHLFQIFDSVNLFSSIQQKSLNDVCLNCSNFLAEQYKNNQRHHKSMYWPPQQQCCKRSHNFCRHFELMKARRPMTTLMWCHSHYLKLKHVSTSWA